MYRGILQHAFENKSKNNSIHVAVTQKYRYNVDFHSLNQWHVWNIVEFIMHNPFAIWGKTLLFSSRNFILGKPPGTMYALNKMRTLS